MPEPGDLGPQCELAEWQPTPPEMMIFASKLNGEICEYKDLRSGDVFRPTYDGEFVDPFTKEPAEVWCLCTSDPVRNPFHNEGWAVEIETGSSLSDLMKKRAN